MIVGNPSVFAIESGITQAYERLSFRALGFFVIHVGGRRYGVNAPEATMLACSVDEVEKRIAGRGRHVAPFASEPDAAKIADTFRKALYGEDEDRQGRYLGIPFAEFKGYFDRESADLMWAPDGDEAFDDGSYVLQFDVPDRVRVIAFKSRAGNVHDAATLSDVWLPADDFYGVLARWREAFEREWTIRPKILQAQDGAEIGEAEGGLRSRVGRCSKSDPPILSLSRPKNGLDNGGHFRPH